MKIVIIGAGAVGFQLARVISRREHDVFLIERDIERMNSVSEDLDCHLVNGNGVSPTVLREVGMRDTDLFAAVTDREAVEAAQWLCRHEGILPALESSHALAWLLASGIVAAAWAAEVKPGLIYDMGGKFDKSFNEAAYHGADKWAKETGGKYRELEMQTEAQREQALGAVDGHVGVGVGHDQAVVVGAAGEDLKRRFSDHPWHLFLAGAAGFEPANADSKDRWLTACRRPRRRTVYPQPTRFSRSCRQEALSQCTRGLPRSRSRSRSRSRF